MSERLKVCVSKSEARRLSGSKDQITAKVAMLENKQNRSEEENQKLEKLKLILEDIKIIDGN